MFAGSGGYTVNAQGGIALNLPFPNIVVGIGATQASAYGFTWNRSPSAPAGVVWFQFTDVVNHNYAPNVFAIIDYFVLGY